MDYLDFFFQKLAIHSRGHMLKFFSRTDTRKFVFFFTRKVIEPWNNLPPGAESENSFKRLIDCYQMILI